MTRKPKARGNIFMRIIMCVLALYAVVMLVDMQVTLADRRQQLADLEQQREQLRLDNKELQRQITQGVDEEEIERIARDKLDYVAPDERVFIDISGS